MYLQVQLKVATADPVEALRTYERLQELGAQEEQLLQEEH